MDELNKIIDRYTEGNYLIGKTAKEEMAKDILALFSVMPRSYGIVRWYENGQDDVVCVDKAKAKEYADKYNKLVGEEVCYVDEDIWLPLNEA